MASGNVGRTVPAHRERIAEDVRWLATAIPLMGADHWRARGFQRASRSWAEAVTQMPLPTLDRVPAAVGRYFEYLHAHYLNGLFEVLAIQRVLQVHGTTLGELDAVYRSDQGTVVHREVAVKYYLGSIGPTVDASSLSAARNWLGPRRRDRLDLKLERLATHQLPLPRRALAEAVWPKGLQIPDCHEVLLLGAFFVANSSHELPEDAEPDVERGFWCASRDWPARCRNEPWVVLEKPWWLSPRQYLFAPPQAPESVIDRVETQQCPVMVGSKWGRGFVVPNGWEQSSPR